MTIIPLRLASPAAPTDGLVPGEVAKLLAFANQAGLKPEMGAAENGALYVTLKGAVAPGLPAASTEWTVSREDGRVLAFNEASGVLDHVSTFPGVLSALAERLLSRALKAG